MNSRQGCSWGEGADGPAENPTLSQQKPQLPIPTASESTDSIFFRAPQMSFLVNSEVSARPKVSWYLLFIAGSLQART